MSQAGTVINPATASSPHWPGTTIRRKPPSGWNRSIMSARPRGRNGPQFLLERLKERAFRRGVPFVSGATTPYVNTIPADQQPAYPGDRELERKIKSIIRWNAMAMVVRANQQSPGIGGHISTYASAATLYEVAFNHFFHGKQGGHAARPGVSSRATRRRAFTRGRILLGRLSEQQLKNFRRELAPGGGLSSYPHPWLMPDFWEFPTVSMGLAPIMAIYQARFNHYLVDRGIKPDAAGLAGLGLPGRRRMRRAGGPRRHHPGRPRATRQPDLRRQLQPAAAGRPGPRQRQDRPGIGRGVPRRRLERHQGPLGLELGPAAGPRHRRPAGAPHGRSGRRRSMQKYTVMPGAYIREHFFGVDPRLAAMVADLSDEQLRKLQRGGHDPVKVYAAYQAAVEHRGSPDGHPGQDDQGLRPGRGRRRAQHHPSAEEAQRGGVGRVPQPLRDSDFRRSRRPTPTSTSRPADSPEMRYLHERRRGVGRFRARPPRARR